MKILITGGAGFIGSHLSKRMSDSGNEVILCDLQKKFSKYQKDNYETIECNVSSETEVNTMLPKVDVIYHLAAQVGTASSLKDIRKDLMWNSLGTVNISQFAIKNNINKFIFSSSMAVYGHAEHVSESTPPSPISPYGISKTSAEKYLNHLQLSNEDFKCSIFRIFNCYGPGQLTKNLTQGLATIFLEQVKRGNIVEVTGSLNRKRDLIYIDDVIDALEIPLKNYKINDTYNLCSGAAIEISALIDMIIKISKKDRSDFQVLNIGGIIEDPLEVTGNNSKLMNTGWSPGVDLEKGLKLCWETMNE